MVKTKEKAKESTISIKTVSRLLPVKLTDPELRQSGDELAATVQEIAAEEDRQKNIKDQLKTRLSELNAKQSRLALRIARKEEYREVQVAIEMHVSGQVSETRLDTGEVLILREAYDEEKQLPLGQQEEIPNEGAEAQGSVSTLSEPASGRK